MSKDNGGDKNKEIIKQRLNQESDREATTEEREKFSRTFDYDYQTDTSKELNKLITVTQEYFKGNRDFSIIKNHAVALMVHKEELPNFFYEMGKDYTEALRHIARAAHDGAGLDDLKTSLKEKREAIDDRYKEQLDKHFSRDKGASR